MKKICIIQTGMGSSSEFMSLCAEIIPEASVSQIIDDGILKEILTVGRLTPAIGRRMYAYCQQAQAAGGRCHPVPLRGSVEPGGANPAFSGHPHCPDR